MFSSTKIMQALSPAAGAIGYQIARSLRFNSADSAYLTRTPASAGNRKTWTWSGWVKRTSLGRHQLFGCQAASNDSQRFLIEFSSTDAIDISLFTIAARSTTAIYRDFSSWYHIVVALDTTQVTANDRLKIYVNGSQITAFVTNNTLTQNADYGINQAAAHDIGRNQSATNYLNGYVTEVYFIDGQALTPSSFGETDATTGVWSPKAYTGTYGTNGFYLNFSDNSGTTATTLGKDSSGNGNNWTPNNFSVTAGAGNDSLVDTPTNYGTDTGVGGEVRGNYATLNPLNKGANATITNGNLALTAYNAGTAVTIAPDSGKYYWEMVFVDPYVGAGNYYGAHAIASPNWASSSSGLSDTSFTGVYATTYALDNPGLYQQGVKVLAYSTWATNDVIGFAFDAGANTLAVYRNGTQLGSTLTVAATSKTFNTYLNGLVGDTASTSFNFGQRPFAYTAPSGFKALCTTNLTTPAIVKPNTNFDVALYTGTGSSLSISSLGFQPDFTWIKGRSGATNHALYDAVRGVQKDLVSNATSAETTETQGLTAFGSTGFTVGTLAKLNTNTATYAAWNWKAGGTGVSNTSGSITSTVSANTTAGISVVTYTGTGANATVGHGLGVAPKFVIVKNRTTAVRDWECWHTSLTSAAYRIRLNNTAIESSVPTMWNSTAPTSTVFSIGTDVDVNQSTNSHVAYVFAEVAGFSKFGKYTGNGSADGPFVYCGFMPRYILMKRTDVTSDWEILDTARDTYNAATKLLQPNLSDAEATTGGPWYDILSNGFKVRTTNAFFNASGGTYIFMAFAESPFNYARAR